MEGQRVGHKRMFAEARETNVRKVAKAKATWRNRTGGEGLKRHLEKYSPAGYG